MKAPLIFLLLATVQICLSAPTFDLDGLESGIAHGGHVAGQGGNGGGVGNGEGSDDDGSSGYGGHADGENGENGDDDGSFGHGDGGNGDNGDDGGSSGHGDGGNGDNGDDDGSSGLGAGHDAVHGVTKTAESASHLDLKRTSQLALNTVDKVVNDARGSLHTVGLGAPAEAVYGAYVPVSQTAHHATAGVADTANGVDGGLTAGNLM